MPSKKELCRSWKLYAITEDGAASSSSIERRVRDAVAGGADAVQLRDKRATDAELLSAARKLLAITRASGVPLIVNDRAHVARDAGADGLHLGQDDGTLVGARAVVGEGMIIGRSTHSPEQAVAAEAEGFDYIGVGPVFETPTKPLTRAVGLDLVRFASAKLKIPFVAIGGIDETNAVLVREAGARCVAVVRAVLGASDPHAAAVTLAALSHRGRT